VPFVPARPSALKHLSSGAASIAIARHFGDVVKAARELGVDRKDLRRLTWHNPRILNAAHERMYFYRLGVRDKIIRAVNSKNPKRQRWGVDALWESYEFRDSRSDVAVLAPAPRQRAPAVVDDRAVLAREAAAELEHERVVDLEREQAAELAGDRRFEQDDEVMVASRLRPGRRDADPVSEVSEILDTSAPEPPVEPSPAESELPAWQGQLGPPPLVAHLYRPWTKPPQEPRRRVARSG
jgi:hypothetical protein